MLTGTMFLWSIVVSASVLGAYILWKWLASKKAVTRWYDWLIVIIGYVMFWFSIQNFYTSFTEIEPLAGWMFLLFPGLPAIVIMGIAVLQVWRRNRATAQS
ncbi:MAG TPA: dehalogenase [Dehalococcoidales bacterium]|nr:dehalogenase [Dehalococcoidales bacterium]